MTSNRALLALLLLAVNPANAEEAGPFTDPEDGEFDASEWLLDRKALWRRRS